MISKELQDTIDAAEDQCLRAVDHVGAANYAERQADAKQWVREAFNELTDAVKMEPHRQPLIRWRKAVADGTTTLGFDDWKKKENR